MVKGAVHPGSLYIPRFIAVIVPLEDTVWLVVNKPAVAIAKNVAIMPIAITTPKLGFFKFVLFLSPYYIVNYVLSINKHYLLEV